MEQGNCAYEGVGVVGEVKVYTLSHLLYRHDTDSSGTGGVADSRVVCRNFVC